MRGLLLTLTLFFVTPVSASEIVVQLGPDLSDRVKQRVTELLGASDPRWVRTVPPNADPAGLDLAPGSLLLGFGQTALSGALLEASERASLPAEGFLLSAERRGQVTWAAAAGRVGDVHGTLYGTFALLEELGLAFLHPLAPTIPAALAIDTQRQRESPRWHTRGWHLHTMHPIELTHVLNGWGPGGPDDAAGWEALVPEWERFCEWAIANRQNEVEWVLLAAADWGDFARGPVRQERLRRLVTIGHAWGLKVGIDVPLALRQQHAHTLILETGDLADEVTQIESGLDYLLDAGFDFVGTELGFSEFTKPDDERMLAWLNAFTEHLASRGKEGLAKVHVSTGQTAKSYQDPETGEALNFNFLPQFADPRLGVMPHTVQHYALDDPAPTYGNEDFSEIHRFLRSQAGKRKTLWYPETAYWVSFDIDVPLFLPVYAHRRVHDLRLLGAEEEAGAPAMDGQMVFSSGWEWGYWLNDVVAARAAWDPHLEAESDDAALEALLRPFTRTLGEVGSQVGEILVGIARDQKELLIEGRVNGKAPKTVEKRNGQAYLQGWETWDEISTAVEAVGGPSAVTQPKKVGFLSVRFNPWKRRDYKRNVAPLLREIRERFAAHAYQLNVAGREVDPFQRELFTELLDAARVTSLRAMQVEALYEFAGNWLTMKRSVRQERATTAANALREAAAIVRQREAHYRVEPNRIAGWGPNPTSYEFGYLWTVRTLHYWLRDHGKAVKAKGLSPAYGNLIDPIDTAFGSSRLQRIGERVRRWGRVLRLGAVTDLFDAPPAELTPEALGLADVLERRTGELED